jgi:hypothetical protein
MYDRILLRWIERRITPEQVQLLVRTNWLTQAQADTILATPQQWTITLRPYDPLCSEKATPILIMATTTLTS